MVSVQINGAPSTIRGEGLGRFTELVELIKSSIDPDHMITEILVDGELVIDQVWNGSVSALGTRTVEVTTGSPRNYVYDQLRKSPRAVQACYVQFRDARKTFQNGDTEGGNQKLVIATDTLRAFFDWYALLLQILPEQDRPSISLDSNIGDILTACKGICQLQLYKSWWALGESLQNDLEPLLDALEDRCRIISNNFQMAPVQRKYSQG